MKVVDASVGFKLLVPETDSGKALALFSEDLHAPDFYPIELTNALRMAEVRHRIADSSALLGDLLIYLPALHSSLSLLPRALEIAKRTTRRSVYDAMYVALAEREQCQLITADTKLVNALQRDFPFVIALDSLQH